MIKVVKNGTVLTPENVGKKDILIAGNKIGLIDDNINIDSIQCEIIDASNCFVAPGFIDNHVHICGGGGEGGYTTRTPEIKISDIIKSGITTIIGVLGTDGTTRTMSNLLAKAYALEEDGVSTFVYTGSYQVPVRTILNSITDDITLFEKIIGVGELAVSDHRSSCPTVDELSRITSAARLGGMLSNKGGVVNLHMGDAKNPLGIIYSVLEKSSIPITQFIPTHMNRNKEIFEDAINYALKGGYVDFTTSTVPEFINDGEIMASKAVVKMLDAGVKIDNITLSSDGQGSLPIFDQFGHLKGLKIGSCSSILDTLKELYFIEKLDIHNIVKLVTTNPASILKLKNKGCINTGYDADLTILKKDNLDIDTVICKGKTMLLKGDVLVKGNFE